MKTMVLLRLKIEAARMALQYVNNDMLLGIGTGSTTREFIRLLAGEISHGLNIHGVATSRETEEFCLNFGIPLKPIDSVSYLDLTVDGLDEIDSELRLIKGRGGALLREKIIANASNRMIVIADESKVVDLLGRVPLPIEIDPFGILATFYSIKKVALRLDLEVKLQLRRDGDNIFVTDGNHYIVDALFSRILNAESLSEALHEIPGVIEHGLFIGMATFAIIGRESGGCIMKRPSREHASSLKG